MMVISLSQVNGVACVCERVVIWTSENMRCWCNIFLYNFFFVWQTMPFPQWINKVILYLVEKSELRGCVKVEVDILGSPSLIVCTLCGHKATRNSSSCRRYWTPVFFCFFFIILFLFFTHVDDGLLDYTELFCTCFRTRTRPRRCRRPGSRWSSGWMRDGSWQGYPVLMQKVRFLLLWYADYYTAFSAFMVY